MHWNTTFLLLITSSLGAPSPLQSSSTDGCGQAPPLTPGDVKVFPITGGREYEVWLPENYDQKKATPMILSYHGANGDMEHQRNLDNLTNPAFNVDHILVYLQGTADDPSRPEHTTWTPAPGSTSDDLGYTSNVLDAVEAVLCIDTSRIYATGKSQGGGFVSQLACDPKMSTRIAAFAPVSGAYYVAGIDICDPATVEVPCNASRTEIPLLAFHGGADGTIPYHGKNDPCLPDIPSWVQQWVEREGLEERPIEAPIPRSDNGKVSSYGDGLITFVYDGDNIDHDWPATTSNSDNERDGHVRAVFDASTMIMDFFRDQKLPN
ncbi:Alpha/Beta hydrolase protein [Camillea tinctor]|nr:Alpha/Beta hydrolase protein [Camillea tinctor]